MQLCTLALPFPWCFSLCVCTGVVAYFLPRVSNCPFPCAFCIASFSLYKGVWTFPTYSFSDFFPLCWVLLGVEERMNMNMNLPFHWLPPCRKLTHKTAGRHRTSHFAPSALTLSQRARPYCWLSRRRLPQQVLLAAEDSVPGTHLWHSPGLRIQSPQEQPAFFPISFCTNPRCTAKLSPHWADFCPWERTCGFPSLWLCSGPSVSVLGQGCADCSPQARSSPRPALVSKASLEHSHSLSRVCGCLRPQLRIAAETVRPAQVELFTNWPFTENTCCLLAQNAFFLLFHPCCKMGDPFKT